MKTNIISDNLLNSVNGGLAVPPPVEPVLVGYQIGKTTISVDKLNPIALKLLAFVDPYTKAINAVYQI